MVMRRQHGGERPPGTTASGKLARAAVLTAPGILEIQEFPLRAIRADEILVKVEACGVCGTDLADHAPFSPRSNRRGLSCEPSAGRHKGSRQSMSRCGLVQPGRALVEGAACRFARQDALQLTGGSKNPPSPRKSARNHQIPKFFGFSCFSGWNARTSPQCQTADPPSLMASDRVFRLVHPIRNGAVFGLIW